MNIDTEFGIHNLPCFLGKTEILMKHFISKVIYIFNFIITSQKLKNYVKT